MEKKKNPHNKTTKHRYKTKTKDRFPFCKLVFVDRVILFCFVSFETGFLYVALAVLDHYVDQASLKLSEIHLLLECCDQRRAPPHLAFFCKFK